MSYAFFNCGYNNFVRLDQIALIEQSTYRFARRQRALAEQPGNGLAVIDLTKERPVLTVIHLADGRKILSALSWAKLRWMNKDVLSGTNIPVKGGELNS